VGHPTTPGSLASLRADSKTSFYGPRETTDAFLYRFFKILAYFDQMVETRIAFRHRVLKAATIEFRGDSIDCVIRDLSTTGAALEVSSQTGIPAKFTLVIPGDALHLPCAVVWRSQYRIGVHFD
jgi:hypothetical protein